MSIWLGNQRLDGISKGALSYSNITNCITNIPQDIKLELNNGTLTLKAGSKGYVPNGAGNFDVATIQSDRTLSQIWATNEKVFLAWYDNNLTLRRMSDTSSGATDRISGRFHWWYDTTNNVIKEIESDGTARTTKLCFPIAIITMKGNSTAQVDSIDNLFNGIGYIDSTVFVLPGVKGLIPNGRNADGTLKNITVSQTSVAILEVPDVSRVDVAIFIKSDHTLLAWGRDGGNVISLATKPAVAPTAYCRAYIEDENLWYHSYATTDWETRDGTDEIVEICAVTTGTNRTISAFRPKTAFRAVGNNEILFMLYPVGSLYFGTQDTCPMALLMPGTLWSWVAKKIVVVTPYDTPIPVTTSSTDALSGAHEPLHMKIASNGNNPSKNLLAVYGDKSVYGIGGTVAEPGARMYPSNLIADVSNSAVTTNVWRRDA